MKNEIDLDENTTLTHDLETKEIIIYNKDSRRIDAVVLTAEAQIKLVEYFESLVKQKSTSKEE